MQGDELYLPMLPSSMVGFSNFLKTVLIKYSKELSKLQMEIQKSSERGLKETF